MVLFIAPRGLFSKTEMTSQVIYADAVKIAQTFKEIWEIFSKGILAFRTKWSDFRKTQLCIIWIEISIGENQMFLFLSMPKYLQQTFLRHFTKRRGDNSKTWLAEIALSVFTVKKSLSNIQIYAQIEISVTVAY